MRFTAFIFQLKLKVQPYKSQSYYSLNCNGIAQCRTQTTKCAYGKAYNTLKSQNIRIKTFLWHMHRK